MPAKSKSQQRAAGMALKFKRDPEKSCDDMMDGPAKQMCKSMSEDELENLADTQRRNLPQDVDKDES